MHSSQNERSRAFLSKVMTKKGRSVGESRASLRDHQQIHQRNSNQYGNQKYSENLEQDPYDINPYDIQQFKTLAESHGGGDYRHEPIYSNEKEYYDNDYVQHKKSQTEFTKKKSDETFSQKSSFTDRSDSTRQTALRKPTKNGKQLRELVGSKASLHKLIKDGITSVSNRNLCACNTETKLNNNYQQRKPNTELLMRSESEECIPCSSSKSAERINDKIIHPMVKKFRLLYLHNIKEEVGIMEDLELLPNKLATFCKEMEKDLSKNS
ncbi:uncharacterized protein LOC129912828 [Episyrphus balteatus]|uniref:uncharacterized protein LOC129912828 n=1 Tax=Episyrphus balteatus TaxID=286459 RepID=UPI0024856B18|nr:uncharacterized protein LOC129912828 [Episyrphus balteatus]